VVLIGLDGLEWNVVLEMLDEKRLPTIARLMDGGIYGELSVTKPTLSPIVWTSIATGVTADTHGINGFIRPKRRKQSAGERLYTSSDRKVKAFWNILSDYGLRVNTVGWWLTYPAEEVNGVMVAQVNTLTPELRRAGRGIWKGTLIADLAGQVYPPEMQETVLQTLPVVEERLPSLMESIFGDLTKLGTAYEALREQSIWAFRADAVYHRVAVDLLVREPDFDLFAVYFGGSDVVGHRFWRFMYPELYATPTPPSHKRKLGEIVRQYYAYLDGVIGDLVAAAPENATIMIVSDHGMLAVRTDTEDLGADLSGGHLEGPPAFFVANGPLLRATPIPAQRGPLRRFDLVEHGSILDVTPTILAMLGAPVGRDMVGRVMRDILNPTLLEKHGIEYVSSHTGKFWKHTQRSDTRAREDVGERINQLQQLGYLD
jgi:predicted AlkP superfamily pyrophosphatase or phosphodiesterase